MIANPVPVSIRHPKMTYQLTITYKLEATLKFETEKKCEKLDGQLGRLRP